MVRSGGQVGDQGIIYTSECEINIKDTQKKMGDLFVHYGDIKKGKIKVGESVNLEIDIEKEIILKPTTQPHIYYMSLYEGLLENMLLKKAL